MFYSIHSRIKDRIDALPDGEVFVPGDFSDIAEGATASKTLRRLCSDGSISKLMRGVFWKGESEPSPDKVAHALARSNCWQAAPCGETALHILGLTISVPERWTYITDGTYRCYEYGQTIIEFRHASGRFLSRMSEKTATLIQAVRAYGRDRITDDFLGKIASKFNKDEIRSILGECGSTTVWIYRTIRRILSFKEGV